MKANGSQLRSAHAIETAGSRSGANAGDLSCRRDNPDAGPKVKNDDKKLLLLYRLRDSGMCQGYMGAEDATDFTVWGIDQTAYGPVELPELVSWVQGERVTAETWVYDAKNAAWQKASQVPELQMFFRPRRPARPVRQAR